MILFVDIWVLDWEECLLIASLLLLQPDLLNTLKLLRVLIVVRNIDLVSILLFAVVRIFLSHKILLLRHLAGTSLTKLSRLWKE